MGWDHGLRFSGRFCARAGVFGIRNCQSNLRNGVVLVTGPTGSGKSSTIAAILDRINETQAYHIITIEDPVEFMHR